MKNAGAVFCLAHLLVILGWVEAISIGQAY